MLKNGNILFTQVRGVKEVTRDKKVVLEYQAEKPNEVHNCQPLPDGRVTIAEAGSGRIIELDRQGNSDNGSPVASARIEFLAGTATI